MLTRVVFASGARRAQAGKKSQVISKRFASTQQVLDEKLVKAHPKEVTELAEDAANTMSQFAKQADTLAKFDQLLEEADRKKALAAVAAAKGKDAASVSEAELYEYRLQQRDAFVKTVDLTKTPLFSAKAALERFVARRKEIEAMGNLPEEAKILLQQEQERLQELANNEEIVEIEVDSDVYEEVKNNLFPELKAAGVSAEEFRDLMAGRGGPDAAMLADPASAGKVQALRTQQVSLADKAAFSVSKKLRRAVAPGDLYPEKRLEFGALETSHPLLQADRKVYIPGEFKNLPNALPLNRAELEKDPSKLAAAVDSVTAKLEKVEFTPTEFNPADLARDLTKEQMEKLGLTKDVQKALLDFTQFEGPAANQPRNASEFVIKLKLWKMWNYFFPYLITEADRKNFMEQFDVSPGERTLEWTLSWPPPDHTFIEVPIYKESADPATATSDEAVQWPRYRVWTDRLFDAELEVKKSHGHEEVEVKNIKAVPLTPQQQQLADQIKQLESQLAPSN